MDRRLSCNISTCLNPPLLTLLVLLLLALCPRIVQPTWWSLSQIPVQSLSTVGKGLCDNIPGMNGRQRRLCHKKPALMLSIVRGASLGLEECQRQFYDNRWNCNISQADRRVFGKAMLKGSRESAFFYAISSAGVVYEITRACSQGHLLKCQCDPTKRGRGVDTKGTFRWGGCSDNVDYGAKHARRYMDARERSLRDARALMNRHNNRAGRKAVKKFFHLQCKCHGVSGACTLRTCWHAMKGFSYTGKYLKRKYDGATLMQMSQSGTELIVANKDHKRPTKNDLVYFEESPDYCLYNPDAGSLGTAGRICNRTSMGPDGCDIMCCGRGYDTKNVKIEYKCDCKFIWCCEVKCLDCEKWVDVHTCKGPNPTPPSLVHHSWSKQKRTRHNNI